MIRCAWMMSVLVMVATLATAADNAWLATPGQSARTWTPKLASQVAWQSAMDATKKTPKGKLRGNQCIGFARGKAFQGTLLRLQGLQTSRSHRMVVIRLADGTIRSWPVNSFSPADQAYLRPFIDKAKARPTQADPKGSRTVEYQAYKAKDKGKTYDLFESPHFAVFLGKDKTQKGAAPAFEPEFMPRILDYMESNWAFNRDALGIPMPFDSDATQANAPGVKPGFHKINIFITSTGLAHNKNGFANGARSYQVHPSAMADGTSVGPHEFGHVMQYYMNGFRGWSAVGSFWETHAQWQMHQFIPSLAPTLAHYCGNAQRDINWPNHRYASWLWLQNLYENVPGAERLPIEVWLKNQKKDGKSVKDPIQTFLIEGKKMGVFGEDPIQGFNDAIGQMAARMPTMDFVNQQVYLDQQLPRYKELNVPCQLAPMEAVEGRPNTWRPVEWFVPGQYGVNTVELLPDGEEVTVSLKKDPWRAMSPGAWRMTLVATSDATTARRSKMTRGQSITMKLKPGERLFASIVGAPNTHVPREFQDSDGNAQFFPYLIEVTGAKPKIVPAPPKPKPKKTPKKKKPAPKKKPKK